MADEAVRPRRKIPSYRQSSAYNASLEGPTAVYRLYDAAGQLLYVGITKNIEQRWYDHSMKQLWWHLVVDKKVAWCDSRQEALIAEEEVERLENPRYGDARRAGTGWRHIPRNDDPALEEAVEVLVCCLREAIERGDYKPGCALPAERDVAKEHGVSIAMARSALNNLTYRDKLLHNVAQGYVVRGVTSSVSGEITDRGTGMAEETAYERLQRAAAKASKGAGLLALRTLKSVHQECAALEEEWRDRIDPGADDVRAAVGRIRAALLAAIEPER